MRFVVLLALAAAAAAAACSGPISPPYITRASGPPDGPRTQRPPENAPPDPVGTSRPGNRSCTDSRDCRPGDTCFAPDFVPVSQSACHIDSTCGEGKICDKGSCTTPCTDTSCPLGQICRRDGHCIAVPCGDPSAPACPMNTRCNHYSGLCDRLSCGSRSECDSGVCFQSHCYSHDAFCMPQSYCCTP
jgi:hypothetical protein